MLSALVLSLPAYAWLGDDGTYYWSESGSGDADAPAHIWVDVPNDPAAVNLVDLSTFDDYAITIEPYTSTTFSFYGRAYTADQIAVSTNGMMYFGASGQFLNSYCCSGNPVPAQFVNEPAIFAFWTDLNPSAGGDMWLLETPTELILHWQDVAFFGAGGANTFQIGLRPDGSFRVSLENQQGANQNGITVGSQADTTRGIEAYFEIAPPLAPTTWLFQLDTTDDDGDGFTDFDDCDDTDADVNPGIVDDDCDGTVSDCGPLTSEQDWDFDGYRVCEGDCDDTNWSTNPGQPEFCDGFDNNCDGAIDEGQILETWYEDQDFDGWGDANGETLEACFPPFGWGSPGDCDDQDPFVNPFVPEDCDDTVDRDCDGDPVAGAIDAQPYQVDNDGDGFGVPPTDFVCDLPADAADQPGDCDDEDPAIHPDVEEIPLDGIDQNCDGREEDDRDEDGLSDADEYALGYDWRHPDSDGDTLLDGREHQIGTSVLSADSDGDGIGDAEEVGNAEPPDSDGDGLIDAMDPDDDDDLWPTIVEGTEDFDGDGIPDHLDTDSDDDGVPDSEETISGRLDPSVPGGDTDDEKKGCGCAAAPSPVGALALLPLLALVRRRR